MVLSIYIISVSIINFDVKAYINRRCFCEISSVESELGLVVS